MMFFLSLHTNFYPRPPRGGRPGAVTMAAVLGKFLSTPSARRATRGCPLSGSTSEYFYPRPPRGGRPGRCNVRRLVGIFLSTPSARRATDRILPIVSPSKYFYPRPPRGGRPRRSASSSGRQTFLSTPSARRATESARTFHLFSPISIHALREEGDDGKDTAVQPVFRISIHALREEGDSKNGEKHLRFCFIIKRSAQIWKSLSKNIRKNSCNLHRTA